MYPYDKWSAIQQRIDLLLKQKDPRFVFYTKEETEAYKKSRNNELFIHTIKEYGLTCFYSFLETKNKLVSLDLETTGLDENTDKIVSLGFSRLLDSGEIDNYFIKWESLKNGLQEKLQEFLYNNIIVFHNAKFDLKFLHRAGFGIDKIDIRDSMISAYLAYPGRKVNLKHLAAEVLELYYDSFEATLKGRNILDIPEDELSLYNCSDSNATLRLEQYFQLFRGWKEDRLYHLELKVCKILCKMEMQGIKVNRELLVKLNVEYEKQISEVESIVQNLVAFSTDWFQQNNKLNISSPKQLQELLYKRLKINTKGIKLNKSGYSTDEGSLQIALNNCETLDQKGILESILEYRKLNKIKSTYIEGLLKNTTTVDRIHTNFNQCLTVTGRLSSSKPNLQNVPKDSRKCFVANLGKKIVAIDYSQCELRILAHFSQEPVLLDAFNHDLDPHLEVAKKLLKKQDISKEERRICKTINFGVIYGMEAAKLAEMTGYLKKDAEKFLRDYWQEFPNIANFMRDTYTKVLESGYTTTLLGRKRYFEFYDKSLLYETRNRLKRADSKEEKYKIVGSYMRSCSEYESKLLREAGNAPIQGSNADITKLAMVATEKVIKDYHFDAHLLLQIHDELVWEVEKSQVADFIEMIEPAMINVIQLDVPLKVDSHFGNNWEETK